LGVLPACAYIDNKLHTRVPGSTEDRLFLTLKLGFVQMSVGVGQETGHDEMVVDKNFLLMVKYPIF